MNRQQRPTKKAKKKSVFMRVYEDTYEWLEGQKTRKNNSVPKVVEEILEEKQKSSKTPADK